MGKLFKNLKPYWKSVLVIVVLLVVQAFCDLSLPQYTSDTVSYTHLTLPTKLEV